LQYDLRTIDKLHSSPLKHTFQVLSTILLQDSQEAQEREAKRAKDVKAKDANTAKKAKDLKTAKRRRTIKSILDGTQLGVSGIRGQRTPNHAYKTQNIGNLFRNPIHRNNAF